MTLEISSWAKVGWAKTLHYLLIFLHSVSISVVQCEYQVILNLHPVLMVLISMGASNRFYWRRMEIYHQRKNYDHYLIKCSRVTLDKLILIGIRSISISKVQSKPSSNIYFKNLFNFNDIEWAAIGMLPRLVTYSTCMWSF